MKLRKLVMGSVLSLGVLGAGFVMLSANENFKTEARINNTTIELSDEVPEPIEQNKETADNINEINEIEETEKVGAKRLVNIEGKIISIENNKITIESADKQITIFYITDETFILDGVELEEDKTFIIYFDQNQPAMMIYPPQYKASVVIAEPNIESKGQYFYKIDYFDNDLLNYSGNFKLINLENTNIVDKNENVYKDDLADKQILIECYVKIPEGCSPLMPYQTYDGNDQKKVTEMAANRIIVLDE